MSELDRIEERYGDIFDTTLIPTEKTLSRLARGGSRKVASEEYFQLKEEKRYSPDKIPEIDVVQIY